MLPSLGEKRFSAPSGTHNDVSESLFDSGETGKAKNFKVVVRVRPHITRECGLSTCVNVKSNQFVSTTRPGSGKTHDFVFDRVYDNHSTQQDIYESAVRPVVLSVLDGYNGSIIAYGQTGTGKTHTIEGGEGDLRGIIPRASEEIFNFIESKDHSNAKFLVRASFLQIYNEKIADLLDPDSMKKHGRSYLKLREDGQGGVVVNELSEHVVRSPAEIAVLLKLGSQLRTTASTNMNRESSRSHAMFSVIVERSEKDESGESSVTIGRLNLVDLAGSERINKTGVEGGQKLDELKNINTSLTAFGKVVLALTSPGNHFVPYRDSKLTRMLQGSLGGNCKTTMITTVTSAENSYKETLNSFKFAKRAKNVKNFAVVNEDLSDRALLSMYEKEIKKLRAALKKNGEAQSKGGGDEVEQLKMQQMALTSEKVHMQDLLEQQTEEAARAMEEKEQLTEKISSLEEQLLQGGDKIEESVEFIHAVQKVEARLEQEYTHKFQEIEEERKKLKREKEKLEREKTELERQRTELLRQTTNLSQMSEYTKGMDYEGSNEGDGEFPFHNNSFDNTLSSDYSRDHSSSSMHSTGGIGREKLSPHPPSTQDRSTPSRRQSRDHSPPRLHVHRHGSQHRVIYTPPTRAIKTGLFDDILEGADVVEDNLDSSDDDVDGDVDGVQKQSNNSTSFTPTRKYAFARSDDNMGSVDGNDGDEDDDDNRNLHSEYIGTRPEESINVDVATEAINTLHTHAHLIHGKDNTLSPSLSKSLAMSQKQPHKPHSPSPQQRSQQLNRNLSTPPRRNLPFMRSPRTPRQRTASPSEQHQQHPTPSRIRKRQLIGSSSSASSSSFLTVSTTHSDTSSEERGKPSTPPPNSPLTQRTASNTRGSLMSTLRRTGSGTPRTADRLRRPQRQSIPRSAPLARNQSHTPQKEKTSTSLASVASTPTPVTTPTAINDDDAGATINDYVVALRNSISGVPMKSMEVNGRIERNVFSGLALVTWFMDNVESIDELEDAVGLGQTFIDVGVIASLDGEESVIPTEDVLYKLKTKNTAKQRGSVKPPAQPQNIQQPPQAPLLSENNLLPAKQKSRRTKSFGRRFFSGSFLSRTPRASIHNPKNEGDPVYDEHRDGLKRSEANINREEVEEDSLSRTMRQELGLLDSHSSEYSGVLDNGASLLHQAAGRGDRHAIKEFIKTNDINVVDDLGRPPLMYACIGNKVKATEYLIGLGADIRMKDSNGHTALVWASYFDHASIIRVLLKHDLGVLELVDPTHRSALHWSVKHPTTTSLDELLSVCSEKVVNLQDEDQVTALHWAVLCQHEMHTLHLLQAGSKLSVTDKLGRSALHYAISNDSPACLTMLLSQSPGAAIVNQKDARGRTVLHLAIGEQRPLEMVMAILTSGEVDVNATDVGARTPLHWAAVCNREDLIEVLVRKGAKLQYRDKTGMTPLHWALEKGFTACADTLQRLATQSSQVRTVRSKQRTNNNSPARLTPAKAFFSKVA
eukprot:m.216546 g.216546  ORF g.216546 m.216546 type:complete len:1488 (-) comp13806_c1_seq3:3847-8310(-)